ncbi:hypothetical protein [Fischerella sp. PCC 9605]|uniref:hypothetical protein n=1 Tax=Fischerella sp. PCC 9605 TaxID=1173024 RepID=UPI0004B9110B|nr:hypothetical protein [Fischerella sp. PCC 9605]
MNAGLNAKNIVPGCPIAVEVFEGNTSDPTTFTNQIEKVRSRFGIKQIIWFG